MLEFLLRTKKSTAKCLFGLLSQKSLPKILRKFICKIYLLTKSLLPEEQLTRYILESSKISGARVRASAFIPPKDKKLSIYRISHPEPLSEEDIWETAEQHVLIPFQ